MSGQHPADSDSEIEEHSTKQISLPREVIENLPEELRDESPEKISAFLSVERIRSPIIPPWLLNQYSAEVQMIIVGEVTERRRHRTKMESRRQILSFTIDILKLLAAFISVILLITGSIDIIRSGQSVEGLLGIGGTVTLVVGAFLYTDHSRRKDKRKAMLKKASPILSCMTIIKQSRDKAAPLTPPATAA